MKWTEFQLHITIDNILRILGSPAKNEIPGEMAEEWEEMKEEAVRELAPVAAAAFGRILAKASSAEAPEGSEALFVILTVGGGLSQLSRDYFASGDYVKGMLADAAADDALFQMDRQLEEKVICLCREKGYGIRKRLEAPSGIGMEIQGVALDAILREEELPVSINESYMYDPVKTLCQVFLLEQNSREYHTGHNCMECGNVSCTMRRVESVPVHVALQEETREIVCREGQSLAEALRAYGISPDLVCRGRGTCGKCGIKLLRGKLPITDADQKCYSPGELKEGYRLSCMAYPKEEIHIAMIAGKNKLMDGSHEQIFEAVTQYSTVLPDRDCVDSLGRSSAGDGSPDRSGVGDGSPGQSGTRDRSPDQSGDSSPGQSSAGDSKDLGIAIDIGSTTIVMQLISLGDGRVMDTYTAMNSQRSYGADVISRIQASNGGRGKELQSCILKDLWQGIRKLVGLEWSRIRRIAVAGNTTMIHLLLGESCEKLGEYPFRPVRTEAVYTDTGSLFGGLSMPDDIPVFIYPGLSAFVGGDIVAGLVHCGMCWRDDISLFVDLGTNGEMALGNRNHIIVSSAAAGPAFEGGNISCGTGSIPGAVCDVSLAQGSPKITTIGNLPPVGICGTGVVALASELIREGLVDETGLLEERYFETGFPLDDAGQIIFTQKDIRELQLAKSAVRAGLEILLEKRGITWPQVTTLYLAGGFGYQLDITRAATVGLLPQELKDRVVTVGNSSLAGAVDYLCRGDCGKDIARITSICEEINLAEDIRFQELFAEYMYF